MNTISMNTTSMKSNTDFEVTDIMEEFVEFGNLQFWPLGYCTQGPDGKSPLEDLCSRAVRTVRTIHSNGKIAFKHKGSDIVMTKEEVNEEIKGLLSNSKVGIELMGDSQDDRESFNKAEKYFAYFMFKVEQIILCNCALDIDTLGENTLNVFRNAKYLRLVYSTIIGTPTTTIFSGEHVDLGKNLDFIDAIYGNAVIGSCTLGKETKTINPNSQINALCINLDLNTLSNQRAMRIANSDNLKDIGIFSEAKESISIEFENMNSLRMITLDTSISLICKDGSLNSVETLMLSETNGLIPDEEYYKSLFSSLPNLKFYHGPISNENIDQLRNLKCIISNKPQEDYIENDLVLKLLNVNEYPSIEFLIGPFDLSREEIDRYINSNPKLKMTSLFYGKDDKGEHIQNVHTDLMIDYRLYVDSDIHYESNERNESKHRTLCSVLGDLSDWDKFEKLYNIL